MFCFVVKMANTKDADEMSSLHNDPNFSVVCSFITRYGTLLGIVDISFEQLEKWIIDTRYVNSTLKDLLIRLLKRWKSSANEERMQQYLIKFCHTYSQYDAWEVEGFGFERCKIETKLRILKNLLECQFDVNPKFREKINEIPALELRCQPLGRDVNGRAYWFLADTDMNIRIYSEEQDDVQNETWQIVVRDRTQLSSLITSLEQQKLQRTEKSRSASPSTVDSDFATATEGSELISVQSITGSDILQSSIKTKDEPVDEDKSTILNLPLKDTAVNGSCDLPDVEVKLEKQDVKHSNSLIKLERPEVVIEKEGESKCDGGKTDQSIYDSGIKNDNTCVKKSLSENICERNILSDESACLVTENEYEEIKSEPPAGVFHIDTNRFSTVDAQSKTLGGTTSTCKNELDVKTLADEISKEQKSTQDDQAANVNSDSISTSLNTTTETLVATSVQKLSVKRKRASIGRTLSTSSSEDAADVAVALSESELSDSPAPNSCDHSAGEEEPPMKRKRDKALKTASQRDRICSRLKNGISHGSPSKLLSADVQGIDVKAAEDRVECIVEQLSEDLRVPSDKFVDKSVGLIDDGGLNKIDVANCKLNTQDSSHNLRDDQTERAVVDTFDNGKSVTYNTDNVTQICIENGTDCHASSKKQSMTTQNIDSLVTQSESHSIITEVGKLAENRGTSTSEECGVECTNDKDDANGRVWDKGKTDVVNESQTDSVRTCDTANELLNKTVSSDDVDEDVKLLMNSVLDKLDGRTQTCTEVKKFESDEENELNKSNDTIIDSIISQETNDAGKDVVNDCQDEYLDPPTNEKKVTQKKGGRKGRKRKGATTKQSAAKINASNISDVDSASGEHIKKLGRPRKSKIEQVEQKVVDQPKQISRIRKPKVEEVLPDVQEEHSSQTLSEDDIPLIELRRSARANKGRRLLEQAAAEQTKKRIRKAEEREKKQTEKEELRLKREEEVLQQTALKTKKKKRGKTEVDDDFIPGKKNGKGKGGRGSKVSKHSRGESEESDGTDEIDEMFEPETEEEVLHFSESEEEQLDSDGSEYVPRGRNAKRVSAIKHKVMEEVIEDKPCLRCGKSDQPEWILLCDRCDAGYHTACLRPPIMVIPEADWFCPICEHNMLIEKLQEQLTEYDKKALLNFRLIQRKERLAFVSVNVSNIITKQEKRLAAKIENSDLFDNEASDEEDGNHSEPAQDEIPDLDNGKSRVKNSRRRPQPQRRRHSYYSSGSSTSETEYSSEEREAVKVKQQRKPKRRGSDAESTDENEQCWSRGVRSCRSRKPINYQCQEFDELITEAIEGDVKSPESNPSRRSKGKDMSNITGVCESSNDKPPANKRKKRNLTQLDSNDEDQDDDSEEFKLTDADEPSSADDDDFVESADSDDTDDWNVGKRGTSRMKPSRSSTRSRRPKRFNDFVSDNSDEESDLSDDGFTRRTRRCVAQRRVNYNEVSNSDSDAGSATRKTVPVASKNPIQRSATRRLRNSDSEYQPSSEGEDNHVPKLAVAMESDSRVEKSSRHKRVGLSSDDSGSEAVSKKKGRLNRIVSSSDSESSDSDNDARNSCNDNKAAAAVATVHNVKETVHVEPVVNGKNSRDVAVTNCNAESLNNRSFAIVNLLKNSSSTSKHCVSDSSGDELRVNPTVTAEDDSLSGIEDLVDYVTQV